MTYRAKYVVKFSNFAGELDRRYSHSESEAATHAAELIAECGELHEGDKITVEPAPL